MSTTIRFRDHEEFHRAALHMAIAGGMCGLAAHVATVLAPGFSVAWVTATLVAAAAFGAADPRLRLRIRDLLVVAVVALGAGLALRLGGVDGQGALFGTAGFAVAVGGLLARGGRRAFLTFVAGAAVALVARWVHVRLVEAGDTAGLPPWVGAAVGGAAFAFICVIGLLPRHVDIGQNRVETAWTACRGALTGEVRELADRAMGVWTKVDASVEQDVPARAAIEDSVIRLFDVARRWAVVDAESRTPVDALVERMESISGKMERTSDEIARNQYRQAHAALAEQLRYLRDIGTARERVMARMHHYLAAMERLRFAVVSSRSADASRLATDVQPILDDLTHLGKEIDLASEALSEVDRDRGDSPTPARAQA